MNFFKKMKNYNKKKLIEGYKDFKDFNSSKL